MLAADINTTHAQLKQLDPTLVSYASLFVDQVLALACQQRASDIHFQPTLAGLELRLRIDGVLQSLGSFSKGTTTDIVTRLKVLAQLLTYRNDIPQEGRIKGTAVPASQPSPLEMRVSTFPTIHGERAVVRLFNSQQSLLLPGDLGFPPDILPQLLAALATGSGVVLLTGPAGSGKTTSAYACLRHLAQTTGGLRSLVSLEDPVEVAVPQVSQSQVHDASGFDFATGLRSLMRQDPEVIFVGEIRDHLTAEIAFQAGLTGHLVLSTFHAGSAMTSLSRLLDMRIEPYVVRSGLRGLISQRLVRQLCTCRSSGCQICAFTGYFGRLLLAEWAPPLADKLAAALLAKADSRELARLALAAGMIDLTTRAQQAVAAGLTDEAEIIRTFGG